MAQETERKFLVDGEAYKDASHAAYDITQGYLCRVPERTVRVRTKGEEAFITVKGRPDAEGVSRFEWEMPISRNDARLLLELAEPGVIEKTRHLVDSGDGHTWEVDVFHGANEGLVIAEIELRAADEPFEKPEWVGREVTGDPRYYNAQLSEHPFTTW